MHTASLDCAWLDGHPLDGDDDPAVPVLTAAEMAAADRAAIAAGTPGTTLMARAADAIAAAVAARFPGGPVLILAGPGNNGGDGWAAATRLAAMGREVAVATDHPPPTLSGDAAWAARNYTGATMPLAAAADQPAGVAIDALFGAGLSRPLDAGPIDLLHRLSDNGVPIVAVDVPSGLDGSTGALLSAHPGAALTVTFHAPKPGHLVLPGALLCGPVRIADIGLGGTPAALGSGHRVNGPALWRSALPRPGPADHKFTRGHLLVIGGDAMAGAARLAALAARRAGAGMVTVAAPAAALPLYQADQPGLLVRPREDLPALLDDDRLTAILAGPGLSPDDAAAVLDSLAGWQGPVVLDGGALFARTGGAFAKARAVGNTVMTPHAGEFARLIDGDDGPSDRARPDAVWAAARTLGAAIALKGADTVIADPAAPGVIFNARSAAYLATAGAGDVLAGAIAGLIAQGMPPARATAAGVWLHGAAGQALGAGTIAEDLPGAIVAVLRRLIG